MRLSAARIAAGSDGGAAGARLARAMAKGTPGAAVLLLSVDVGRCFGEKSVPVERWCGEWSEVELNGELKFKLRLDGECTATRAGLLNGAIARPAEDLRRRR